MRRFPGEFHGEKLRRRIIQMSSMPIDLEENTTIDGARIKVIGVGGGGNNAVDRMIEAGVTKAEFICVNTDAQQLSNVKAPTVLQIGAKLTNGLGAGAKPEIGRQAAEETKDEIKNLVRGLNPIMGAYSHLIGKKIKFWKVDVIPEDTFMEMQEEFAEYAYKLKDVLPGTILYVNDKRGLYIKGNGGILSVLEVQGENAKKMPVSDFLRGNKIQVADMFEQD